MNRLYIESLVIKWNTTGLLTGLNSKEKEDLAQKLESILDAFLYGEDIHTAGNFKSVEDLRSFGMLEFLFPIQRRIKEHEISLRNNELRIDRKKYMTIDQFIEQATQTREDFSHYIPFDDGSLCRLLAEKMKAFAMRSNDYHTVF